MRQVFSNAEIPHLWAHQRQTQARNASQSYWFTGDTLYSYREPIGRVSGDVVLFRHAKFTITTARHQSGMRQAARHLRAFTVRHLSNGSFDPAVPHDRNLDDYQLRIDTDCVILRRSRKANRDYRLTAMVSLVDEANRYADWAGIARRFTVPTDESIKKMLADERAANARERQRERELAETIRRENAENIAKWVAGESVNLPYNLDSAYLRIEGDDVATSKGARVPIDHVMRALPIVTRLIDRGGTYQRNGHSIHLGYYTLDRIDADGNVYAGCHTFAKAEILRFATVLNCMAPVEVLV